MKFLFSDTKKRYKGTLASMEPDGVDGAGAEWDQAGLGFYFRADTDRAHLSVRDTLAPILREDHRKVRIRRCIFVASGTSTWRTT